MEVPMRFTSLILALPLVACGGGNANGGTDGGAPTARSYPLSDFTRIASAVPADVDVTTGAAFSVRASGDAEAIERLELAVDSGTLTIRQRRDGWNWGRQRTVRINIVMPRVEGASIAGAGDMTIDRGVGDFAGSISGAGNMTVGRIEGVNIRLAISGAGDLAAAGHAQAAELEVAGTGSIRARELIARSADVSVAGAGDVTATVDGEADVSVAGVGSVDLGSRARCRVRKAGIGNVTCGA
jgi:hypothetical protein